MFDLIGGLPLHPLVVHAVVVLLPLAAVGTVAIAVVPAWRRRFGILVALAATAATAMVPVATNSGEALMRRVGPPAGNHDALGGQLLWFALPLAVLVWLLVLADVRARRPVPASPGPGAAARGGNAPDAPRVRPGTPAVRSGHGLVTVLAVLAVLSALAALFQVYRVGDSGARSVWGDVAAVQIR
jgi:uncharacterized membrane protein